MGSRSKLRYRESYHSGSRVVIRRGGGWHFARQACQTGQC
jgi:hypothetical protein